MNQIPSRTLYDTITSQQQTIDSMAVFKHRVDSESLQTNCLPHEISPTPQQSIPKENINIESDLRGQNVVLTRYGETRVNECLDCNSLIKPLTDCDNFLTPQYSRFEPNTVLKGINVNRFDHLCEDYQSPKMIYTNDVIGVNTRLLSKDTLAKKL